MHHAMRFDYNYNDTYLYMHQTIQSELKDLPVHYNYASIHACTVAVDSAKSFNAVKEYMQFHDQRVKMNYQNSIDLICH